MPNCNFIASGLLAIGTLFFYCSQAKSQSTNGQQNDLSWPRFLGENYDNVGVTGDRQFDWSVEPELLWSLTVGDGYGLGSVAGSHYFQFDNDDRGRGERLRCIDLNSGKTVWESISESSYVDMVGYEPGPRGTPTVHGDSVYTHGVTGELMRRKIEDGEILWKVDTNKKFSVVQNFFGVGSSPLIMDDRIIVAVGGSPPAERFTVAPGRLDRVSPAGSALVAFDIEDGSVIWKSGDDLASYSSPRPAVLNGKSTILYFARDHIMAFDSNDGDVLWKVRHRADLNESVNGMVPIVDGNRIFISECYQVGSMLLDATGGEATVVWRDPPKRRREQAMRCHWSTPILIDGFLYGGSGRNPPDSDIRCVEYATGKVQWVEPQRVRASVAGVADHLIVWTERGRLQVIKPDPEKMRLVAEWDLSEPSEEGSRDKQLSFPCWAAPIVVGDRLILRGDRQVWCMKLATN